jgi:hypothetical protein
MAGSSHNKVNELIDRVEALEAEVNGGVGE